ncbi:MAG: DNA-directed RNA polymerase subunit beta', partial [Bacteroidota bacterium]
NVRNESGELVRKIVDTTMGRILFNVAIPEAVGYVNELMTKKSLRDLIGMIVRETDIPTTAAFLDQIKEIGFKMAFKGGLSFNLNDVMVPDNKVTLIDAAHKEVEEVTGNYNMGFITNNERYNQVIDIWTRTNSRITDTLMKEIAADKQGFNSVYMMLDSGARGSKEQIRQLGGMRGLMAKPQKSGGAGEIIENPILSNFKEGLNVLEYFISTHGARKGLADTALKTADAGYLTRRLHDVAQDVIINEEDCGTLRGIEVTALKDNEDVVEPLKERIVGRVTASDVVNPLDNKVILAAGEEITEAIASMIEASPVEAVEIRSVLTCASVTGVCVKCYGRNLATNRTVQIGESVGVIAAQSIGEPGTQLTLRTFHVGGVAGNIATESQLVAKFDGLVEFDEVRTVTTSSSENDNQGGTVEIVVSRSGEIKIMDPKTRLPLMTNVLPYGATLFTKAGAKIKKGDLICSWDPYNALIISEFKGKADFEHIAEGVTYREESDEQTGHKEKVII